jgi:hypothetical protein
MVVVVMAGGWSVFNAASGTGQILGRFSDLWSVGLALYGCFLVSGLGILIWAYRHPDATAEFLEHRVSRLGERVGVGRWILLVLILGSQIWLLLGPAGDRLTPIPLRILLFTLAASLGAALLPKTLGPYQLRWLTALMLFVFGFFVAKEFNLVRTYPFKLTWSEGNRIWDYSLYFGQNRYQIQGQLQFPSYMAPGRHGLWGLAFLLPGLKIWGARLWNAFLWISPGLLLGWVLLRRIPGGIRKRSQIMWVLWVFLFVSQGPIYAPLILAAALLVWGYSSSQPVKTGLVVALACLYAGTSRWTWMAAPALWAGAWAVLDSPNDRVWWRRAAWPAVLGLIGLAGGWLSQIVVDIIHPSDGPVFATSFNQALLWYRLFPSSTNPLGILPGAVLATGPLLAGWGWAIHKKWVRVDWLEALALAGVLLSTLAVGLIASVKIGGGNNLHNLDMYLVSLVILTALLLRRLDWAVVRPQVGERMQWIVACILVIPVGFNLQGGEPLDLPDEQTVNEAIAQIRDFVEDAAEEGEILFLDQRQLLTFGQVDVPLVVDYELKDLTNKAMIGDPLLFSDFYEDLRSGRFGVIVTGHLPSQWRGRGHPFGEEDDAQLEFIYLPLQQYYQPAVRLDEVGVWLLVPLPSDLPSNNETQGSSP